MSPEQELVAIINQADKDIAEKERLDRLKANPDFVALIMEGYITKYPAILISTLADLDPVKNEHAVNNIKLAQEGITAFIKYLNAVNAKGVQASYIKEEAQTTLLELDSTEE